jgi:CRP/FNR family transcriptional regulator, cyclic AMP receptor protein
MYRSSFGTSDLSIAGARVPYCHRYHRGGRAIRDSERTVTPSKVENQELKSMQVDELVMSPHAFLKGMREQHLRSLSEVAMRANFAEGEWIFREGERADRFYLIEEGSAIITARMRTNSQIVIQTLGPGDAVGWAWLIEPYMWYFDARADEATCTLSFNAVRLREQCKEDPKLSFELMKRVTHVLIDCLQGTRLSLLDAYAARGIEM